QYAQAGDRLVARAGHQGVQCSRGEGAVREARPDADAGHANRNARLCRQRIQALGRRGEESEDYAELAMSSSWPGLARPSTPFRDFEIAKTWMPGTRPGMTPSIVN